MQALIYTDSNSPKCKYVFSFLLKCLGLNSFNFTSQTPIIDTENRCLIISYHNQPLPNSVQIPKSSYFENFEIEGNPILKKALVDSKGAVSFDFIASMFFLLARVEEYRPHHKDTHGRYLAKNSLLFKKQLLELPVVDIWIKQFRELCQLQFPKVGIQENKYAFKSTLDIDHFFAYKHKALKIKVGAFLRDLLRIKWGRIIDRFLKDDPYDTLNEIEDLHALNNISPLFFILTSKRTNFDKSLSPSSKIFHSKVKEISRHDTGLHPSYYAQSHSEIKIQKNKLEEIVGKSIIRSRQHFIRLSLPSTYRELLKAGLKADFSMGYPEAIGFRAGTSLSFKWYDITKDEVTDLMVFPFQIMDVTMKNYLSLGTDDAFAKTKQVIEAIREVGGIFTLVWHNSSFYEREGWSGWKGLYKDILAYASN